MINPLIAIVGPTASGKTALATALALEFGGELVSADSKQVYRGMDIGTAKELDLPVAQHLVDWKNPGEKVTVAQYQAEAYACIDDLHQKKILPILVGGSGLYAESVTLGYEFSGKGEKVAKPRYRVLEMGIAWEREALKKRAVERTETWLKQGLLAEIEGLLAAGVSAEWLETCGMEYRYFTQYLRGEVSYEAALALTNTAINQFIKRQYTWFRRHPNLVWVKSEEEARQLVRDFLAST